MGRDWLGFSLQRSRGQCNKRSTATQPRCSRAWTFQSDNTAMTVHLASSKTQLLWKLLFWCDTLHRLEFMLLSKTWPFGSKLSDTSFEEQLKQNTHNLQSKGKPPCSSVPVFQQRLYCKLQEFAVSAVIQEERLGFRLSEEERAQSGTREELPNTREAPENREPCQDPLCLSALAYTAIEERRIQNTNTGRGRGKFAAGERGGGAGKRRGRKQIVVDVVRKWLWEAGVTEEGVYHSAINTRPGNRRNDEAEGQIRLHPAWTKCCRMTVPSYVLQLWTPHVYTGQRLIPASESATHRNNKTPRLKATKHWDSLNKSYCWQQASPSMWTCVCWTHFRNGRKCWQKVFIFLFEIYIHCTTAEAKLMSPWSLCAGCQNDLSCVSVCLPLYFFVCERNGGCVWVHSEWFMEAAEAWPERTKAGRDSRVLCASEGFLLPTGLPRWQIVGVAMFHQPAIIFTKLPIESCCHPGILGQSPMLRVM